MSWAPEVIADSTGKFVGNALRFATKKEAEDNVHDLFMRWTLVRETRVVESTDPVNYCYKNGKLEKAEEAPAESPVQSPETTEPQTPELDEYDEQAYRFLARHNISFHVVLLDCRNNPAWNETALRNHYRCTLRRNCNGHRQRSVSFKCWDSINNTENNIRLASAYPLLACLTKSDPGSFDNFRADFGYDNTATSRQIYRGTVREWAKVQRFFTGGQLQCGTFLTFNA